MRNQKKPASQDGNAGKQMAEFDLCLFVTGVSPNSIRAINNIKEVCETHLQGRYSLEIIDIYQHPGKAEDYQIIALPLLIKRFPAPEKRLIGDMSDTGKVLKGLGLQI